MKRPIVWGVLITLAVVASAVALTFALVAAAASSSPAQGPVPSVVAYQGLLADAAGSPVSDGTRTIAFRIYSVPTGGTPLWQETQQVTTAKGVFNVLLGSTTPFGDLFGSSPLYLGVQVEKDPEMQPRRLLAAVPFAMRAADADNAANADTLGGKDASAFASSGQSCPSGQVMTGVDTQGAVSCASVTTSSAVSATGATFLYQVASAPVPNGQLNRPTGIAVSSQSDGDHVAIWVADTGNARYGALPIEDSPSYIAGRESYTLNFLDSEWFRGGKGYADGQFTYPTGIAVGGGSDQFAVYVVDMGYHRVQKFDYRGTFVSKWGSVASGPGGFNYPYGIALDGSGNVYVVDPSIMNIQKFSSSGTFLKSWGTFGSGNGQFWHPHGIAVDSNGNIFVADTDNNRIQMFDSRGLFVRAWGSLGSGDGQFDHPYGIAVDSSGHVYVADTSNHRIQEFVLSGDPRGGCPSNTTRVTSGVCLLRKWGSFGVGHGEFDSPKGVAVDVLGRVYVADTGNNRIQVFAP